MHERVERTLQRGEYRTCIRLYSSRTSSDHARLQYADLLFGEVTASNEAVKDDLGPGNDDIEAEINREMHHLQQPKQQALFVPVKIEVQCGQSLVKRYFSAPGSVDAERHLSPVL